MRIVLLALNEIERVDAGGGKSLKGSAIVAENPTFTVVARDVVDIKHCMLALGEIRRRERECEKNYLFKPIVQPCDPTESAHMTLHIKNQIENEKKARQNPKQTPRPFTVVADEVARGVSGHSS